MLSSFSALPLCKSCCFISHLSKYCPPPLAFSLPTALRRQLHLRKPSTAPLFATNFDISEEIELHAEIHGQEAPSDVDLEEEELENFDAEELEIEARRAVKEFSDSLSRELNIGSFYQIRDSWSYLLFENSSFLLCMVKIWGGEI